MKTNYPKAMWLIIGFYALIVIVGGGQILWAYRFGDSFDEPTIHGFYMVYRIILSLGIIALFSLARRAPLYWMIVIESATNIFVTLYAIYCALWLVCACESWVQVLDTVGRCGIITGWNALLCLISAVILGYMVANWNRLLPHPVTL